MPYVRTQVLVLRCTDYSEHSQVVAMLSRDMGQFHGLAKGSRRPRKDGRAPFDVLTHCDVVFARRKPGNLHLITEWSARESFPSLRRDLRRFWAAFYGAEVALCCTSENPDDGPVYAHLLAFLRRMEEGEDPSSALFGYLTRALRTLGDLPVVERCVQCSGHLFGRVRFSPGAGGALCEDCAAADPTAFGVSLGALAVLNRLANTERGANGLRVAHAQAAEIRRALNEHIQYHLGRTLRTAAFLDDAAAAPTLNGIPPS